MLEFLAFQTKLQLSLDRESRMSTVIFLILHPFGIVMTEFTSFTTQSAYVEKMILLQFLLDDLTPIFASIHGYSQLTAINFAMKVVAALVSKDYANTNRS